MNGQTSTEDINTININLTHPNFYRTVMVFGFLNVALGLNFLFARPTFNQYEIPKEVIGSIFLILGISKIIFLHFYKNLKLLRLLMALEVAFMIFWGVGTSITFFTGQTSLQLFILYTGFACIELFFLLEPVYNPLTAVKSQTKKDV